MDYEIIYHNTLGTNKTQIGSNLSLMTNIDPKKSYLISDYLDVPASIQLFRNQIYIADKYNKRILVQSYQGDNPTNWIISAKGSGYEFLIPFQIILNKYGEIYVLAQSVKSTNSSQYNLYKVYKFSIDGHFLYTLGEDGVGGHPFEYPIRMDIDLFNNLYLYFKTYDSDNAETADWLVRRYSPSGELNFEFNTRYLSLSNQIGNETYSGRVSDIFNLKNDERLLLYSDFSISARDKKTLESPDKFYKSLDVYSLLQNSITRNLFQSSQEIDAILGITRDDDIVLYAYDTKFKGVHFTFIPLNLTQKKGEELNRENYYSSPLSQYLVSIGYYIDSKGEIYSILVKENKDYLLLHWIKKKPSHSG